MATIKNNADARHDWQTPKELFDYCCTVAGFVPEIDVAATKENSMCGDSYIDSEMNALTTEWITQKKIHELSPTFNYYSFWLNAPNNLMSKFIPRAFEQYDKYRHFLRGIAILPMQSIATAYTKPHWNKYVEGGGVYFHPIWKRPKFRVDGKDGKWTSPFAYGMLVFGSVRV